MHNVTLDLKYDDHAMIRDGLKQLAEAQETANAIEVWKAVKCSTRTDEENVKRTREILKGLKGL